MPTVFRNTLAQAAAVFSSQGFSFLLAPIMIDRLGLTLFGVWTVVGAVAMYATVLDAGITRALARFIALYDARGDTNAIRECVGLGMCAFTLIGILLIPLAWLCGSPLASILGHVGAAQMRQILLAATAIFLVQGYSGVLQAVPQGLRRMVPPNIAVVVGNTINFGASVTALVIGPSLARYAWANAGAETVSALLVLISVRYVWRTRLAVLPSRERIREVLAFSVQSQLSWISSLINLQSDKLVIGLLVSPQAAGAYQLGSSVAGAIRGVGLISILAMIPTATVMIAKEGRDLVRELALHYLPRVLGVSLPIFAVTALTAPFLFTVWIDRSVTGAIPVVIALNVAYAINMATEVPSTISIADGRPGFVSRNAMQMATLNLVLTAALAPFLGLAGVVAGTVAAVSVMSVVFVVSFARSYGISAKDLREAILPPTMLSILVAVPLVPLVLVAAHLSSSRFSTGAILIGLVACYGMVYWPLASLFGVLPERLVLKWVRAAQRRIEA